MGNMIVSGLVGLIAGLVLTPLFAALARRVGLLDHPNYRKKHLMPTPLVGGPVLAVALALSTVLFAPADSKAWTLLLALAVLVVTGVVDDKSHLPARWKFLVQGSAAAALIMLSGLMITSLGPLGPHQPIELGRVAIPFTIFAVVGVVNAVNMVDGVDGLAAGLCVVALLLFAAAGSGGGWTSDCWVTAAAATGALLGFLAYNAPLPGRRHARVFLGDSGSMLLGFLLAWLAITTTQPTLGGRMPPVLAVWFLGVPIMDTLAVMLRRMLSGHSPFYPDRRHLHHLCLQRGWSVARTTYTLCALQAALAAGAWGARLLGARQRWLMAAYLLLFAGYFLASFKVARREPVKAGKPSSA